MRYVRAALAGLAIACFRGDLPALPATTPFAPAAGAASGWLVHTTPTGLTCPDGEPAEMVLVHPEQGTGAIPVTVVFHSGAFDYVLEPDPEAPLAGLHYASPDRLTAAFAARQIHATLGMFPPPVELEEHTGQLAAALTGAGSAVLLPPNCWGDLWASRSGQTDSDVPADFFRREGRTAAEWAVGALLDGVFADEIGASLPVQLDPRRVYAVGLGTGGRAVMELLRIDRNLDGAPDLDLAGVLLDSSPDDLRPWVDDPGGDLGRARGIARIHPDGDVGRGSVWQAPWLPPTLVYVYSSVDPVWPAHVHDAALARLESHPGAFVLDAATEWHVQSDGALGPSRTTELVDALMR